MGSTTRPQRRLPRLIVGVLVTVGFLAPPSAAMARPPEGVPAGGVGRS